MKVWEIINYICLGLLIIGQVVIGFDFWIGQSSFLLADIFLTVRSFAIHQEKSDKVKNVIILSRNEQMFFKKFFKKLLTNHK